MLRLHIFGRTLICPFSDLIPYFPASGDILDVGCGHGLLSQLLYNDVSNKGRRLFGIDHDVNKINIAKRYANSAMRFSQEPLEDLPKGRFDAVSLVDVLYCVSLNKWQMLLDHCFRILRPGGRLIVKEVVNRPRWKLWITMFEEKLAVEILKITKGDKPHIESAEAYSEALKMSNFTVFAIRPLDRWRLVSHCVFIAHKEI